MAFFADERNFEVCEFYSLACYLAVGGGSRHLNATSGGQSWVFPCFANISTTKAISKMLKELSKTVDVLPSDVTATELRVGSVNEIINAEGDAIIIIFHCRIYNFMI